MQYARYVWTSVPWSSSARHRRMRKKMYVSKLLGMLIAVLEVDGVIVTTEGFGNNYVDFASRSYFRCALWSCRSS